MIAAPTMEEQQPESVPLQDRNKYPARPLAQLKTGKRMDGTQPSDGTCSLYLNLPVDMAAIFERLTAQERAVLWLAHVEGIKPQGNRVVFST